MKEYYYILTNQTGTAMKAFKSKFEREVGDYMNIDGIKMRILSAGFDDYKQACDTMHEAFKLTQTKRKAGYKYDFFKINMGK